MWKSVLGSERAFKFPVFKQIFLSSKLLHFTKPTNYLKINYFFFDLQLHRKYKNNQTILKDCKTYVTNGPTI
jgi:hypothetical protein